MKKQIKLLSILLGVLLIAVPAKAEVQMFMGKGSAIIINGDEASARKIAYQAARRKALTNAMKSLLHKGQKDEINFNRKKAKILKGPYPYLEKENQVNNYKKGKMLNIDVSITVDISKLKSYLGKEGILVTENKEKKKAEFPAVMVIIAEEIGGNINTVPYTTAIVVDHLLKNKYEVLDEKIVQKNISQEQAVQATNGNMAAAHAVALQYGSGIVITGKTAVQQSALKSGGLQAYGANITLMATKADTGDILATASADGSFPHINAMTGSRKAAEQAAKKAIKKIVKDLEKGMETSSSGIVMTINPINYKQLAIIKKMLKRDFKEISVIKQKSFAGKVAKLDVQYEGLIVDFADAIALKDFGTFSLEVIQFSPGKIDCILKMN